jgi:zinc protease
MSRSFVAPMRAGLVATLVALSGLAAAQTYDMPPPPGPPRPLAIDAPSEQSLPNGLRVIVARRQGVPIVSATLLVLSGSETDPPRLAGLASLTAGLLTQGTKRHTAPQLAAAAEALGGSLDSGAGWGQSTVSITVTTPRLGAALALVSEVAREPTFAQEEIDRLRSQTLDGLKVAYSQPGTISALTAARLAYGNGPWGRPASGTPASLPRIGHDDIVALHRTSFRPDRAVLILAGDVTPADGLALAKAHFGTWKAPSVTPPAATPPPTPIDGPAFAVVDMPSAGQAAVTLALPLPKRDDAERSASNVLNAVLGGGYSSRLNQEIRINRGLSYGVGSQIGARGENALLQASVQTKNESAAEVVKLLQAEFDRIMQSPVPADELTARKATLIGGFSRSVETTGGLAAAIGGLVATGRPPAELKTRIASLEAVTGDDVQRYASAHLGAAGRRVVVAGVAGTFAAALKAEVPGLVVVGQDALDFESPAGLERK